MIDTAARGIHDMPAKGADAAGKSSAAAKVRALAIFVLFSALAPRADQAPPSCGAS